MQKNNRFISLWRKWRQSPDFSKNLYFYVIFLIVFAFVIFFAWKQLTQTSSQLKVALPPPITNLFQNKSNSLILDRLTHVETQLGQAQQTLSSPYKLITLELLRGVLDGMIPLEELKKSLQKNTELWAKDMLTTITPLTEGKTYPQLETLLVLSPAPTISSWQRLKNSINSFIHIRKINEKNEEASGSLEDIHKALQEHNIQKAITIFEKLSSEEKIQLSSWKKSAEERLLLENCTRKLLLELAGSQNP